MKNFILEGIAAGSLANTKDSHSTTVSCKASELDKLKCGSTFSCK